MASCYSILLSTLLTLLILVVLYQPVESLAPSIRGIGCSSKAYAQRISTHHHHHHHDMRRKSISTTISLSMPSSDGSTAASLSKELDIDGSISSWSRLVSAIPKKRDDLDRKILSTALPTMLNLMVVPLVSVCTV